MLKKLAGRFARIRDHAPAPDLALPSTEAPVAEFQMELWGGRRPCVPALPEGSVVGLDGAWAGHYGALISAGQSIATPPIRTSTDHVLQVAVVARSGFAAVDVEFAQAGSGGAWHCLFKTEVAQGQPTQSRTVSLDLRSLGDGPWLFRVRRSDSSSGTCVVQALQICAANRVGLLHAQSDYTFRLENEIRNFSGNAYTHAMYGDSDETSSGAGSIQAAKAGQFLADDERRKDLRNAALVHLAKFDPLPNEVAFNYALRALGSLLPTNPPNFFQRASEISSGAPIKVLSICAGAARVEEQILEHCACEVELTLLDASLDLMSRAADRLSKSGRKIHCLVGDINLGLPGEGAFDLIVCVSAMHHVVELERVLSQINERLRRGGEFWSIGEQVGRNGNRLWPDAYAEANEAFAALPATFRKNAHTGDVDSRLDDRDYSVGCFEGVRSEELEELFERHFIPVDVYKRNAFLWRLVDATYSDNYRLDQPDDLKQLRALVAAEAVHWCMGGRSTELHGVYRKKVLAL